LANAAAPFGDREEEYQTLLSSVKRKLDR